MEAVIKMSGTIKHISQINRYLENNYETVKNRLKEEMPNASEEMLMTRLLTAHVLRSKTDISTDELYSHITDGPDDRGIDGLYYSHATGELTIVQSKWSKKHNAPSISERDASELINGLIEVLDGSLYEVGNKKLLDLKSEISLALENFDCIINVVVACMSDRQTTKKAQGRIDKGISNVSDDDGVEYIYMGTKDIYSTMSNSEVSNGCDFELRIGNCASVSMPYLAYFGYIDGLQIAEIVNSEGVSIYAKNLRGALGKTSINEEIVNTTLHNPELFWYYNNGITFIADEVKRKKTGGLGAENAHFRVVSASIVNGAQTTSTLASLYADTANHSALEDVKCLVRIIQLPEDNSAFSLDVTRFNNSQNQIGSKDFVSLDPFQKELQKSIDHEYAINYFFAQELGLTQMIVPTAKGQQKVFNSRKLP